MALKRLITEARHLYNLSYTKGPSVLENLRGEDPVSKLLKTINCNKMDTFFQNN